MKSTQNNPLDITPKPHFLISFESKVCLSCVVLSELSLCEDYSNQVPTYEGHFGKVVKNRHRDQISQPPWFKYYVMGKFLHILSVNLLTYKMGIIGLW